MLVARASARQRSSRVNGSSTAPRSRYRMPRYRCGERSSAQIIELAMELDKLSAFNNSGSLMTLAHKSDCPERKQRRANVWLKATSVLLGYSARTFILPVLMSMRTTAPRLAPSDVTVAWRLRDRRSSMEVDQSWNCPAFKRLRSFSPGRVL